MATSWKRLLVYISDFVSTSVGWDCGCVALEQHLGVRGLHHGAPVNKKRVFAGRGGVG